MTEKAFIKKLDTTLLHQAIDEQIRETMREIHRQLVAELPEEIIEGYKFVTEMDDKVCERCARLQGMVFPKNDKAHRPPLHPNCRCRVEEPVHLDLIKMEIKKHRGWVSLEHAEIVQAEYDPRKKPFGFFRKIVYEAFVTFAKQFKSIVEQFFKGKKPR